MHQDWAPEFDVVTWRSLSAWLTHFYILKLQEIVAEPGYKEQMFASRTHCL